MQYTRPRTNCLLCPFKAHKHVYSELVASESKPTIAILGEAPGREEDRDGKPFVGPSGKLVNWALHTCGVTRNNVYVANSICCHPTDGRIDTLEASEALGYCRAGLFDELVAQYDRGLRVLVALGQTAMDQLGLKGKVGTFRGSLMEVVLPGNRKLTVIPTYHPAVVLKLNWKRSSGGTAKGAVEWLADWQKAATIAKEGGASSKQLRELFSLEPTVEQIEEFCNLAVVEKKLVAVDIETSGLGFDACKIVVVGLAIDKEHALCVPFLREGATPCFTNGSWERVKGALRRLFANCEQVYQNCFFDVPRLRAFGFDIPYALIKHDTLVLHHCLAAECPHDLGYIVSVYGRTPYWKDDFKNRVGTIYDMNQIEMRRYNLRDCVVLHQILETMLVELHDHDLESIYYTEAMPLVEPIMEMTQYGVGIDLGRVRRYKAWLEGEIETGTKALYELGHLPPEFNVASSSQMAWLLYGEPIEAFKKIDERDAKVAARNVVGDAKLTEAREKLTKIELALAIADRDHKPTATLEKRLVVARAALDKRLTPKPTTQIERDIEALRIVRDTVRPIYSLASYRPLTTESGLLATDKEGLLSYKIALTNRRATALELVKKDTTDEVAAIDTLLAFIDKLGAISRMRKMLSTYTNYEVWSDGRVHPYFKLHGTASGRLCVHPDTLVETPQDRSLPKKKLRDLKEGDWVYSFDEDRELCLRRVKWVGSTGVKPTLVIHTDKGPSLTISRDHLVRKWGGSWVHAKDLKVGDRLLCMPTIGDHEGYDSFFPHSRNRSNGVKGGGRFLVHRFVWKETNGKKLGGNSVIHHIDGNKRNNSPENLLWVMGQSAHTIHHSYAGVPGMLEKAVESGVGKTGHVLGKETLRKYRARLRRNHVVTLIDQGGETELWDLEVEGTHTFIGNDVALHNSCNRPNLQNAPHLDPKNPDPVSDPIRGFFTTRPGHKFISADYVNLEAQLLAYSTLDPELVQVFTNGLNLHDVNTRSLFGVEPDDVMWGPCRRAAKIDFFANKCYGGSDYAIYSKIMLEVPELRMTFAQYRDANAKWFATHPRYTAWANAVRTEVKQHRQARTPFGRVRYFLDNDRDIEKEALNHMIQSSGASLVNRAMIRIEKRLRAAKSNTRFVLQVHDELILEAPDAEVERSKAILVEEMSRPFEFLGFTRSIPVEAAIGDDLASI